MKKTTFILIVLAMVSCVVYTKDRKKFVVNDFSKVRLDTLIPIKNKSYYAYYIKVKGSVNNSIKIKSNRHDDIILSGTIDTLLNGDYYGGDTIIWAFDPYKAKKGKLEIEYAL
ncbi:hypothetical protein PY092_08885 [Muricauda sp. 334s03]|uniref:Uncharacterized protein n=1 Tax=Flagellimonas yonaguniensis TaxID=3031325 RepID=A0ABT5XYJ5_9FLAO|nr:hypothetical protein [[Muricauda] yonaguniensis]MDF0716259.1 hypothetical protein [[Muricauda] yonaguniensis]